VKRVLRPGRARMTGHVVFASQPEAFLSIVEPFVECSCVSPTGGLTRGRAPLRSGGLAGVLASGIPWDGGPLLASSALEIPVAVGKEDSDDHSGVRPAARLAASPTGPCEAAQAISQ
jgi:hypothetical protein